MVETVLGGRKKLQRRAVRAGGWTKRKEALFIEALTESCNVTLSAGKAGISVSAVYRRRASDASFRAAWGQAVSVGYAQLEMMLLERALHGIEKPVAASAGKSGVMRHYDDRTALALLKHHRESAEAVEQGVDTAEHEEACERILARLARLRERMEAEIETKSAGDGWALLRWAASLVERGRR